MCGRFSLEQYPTTIIEHFDLPTYPKFNPKYNIAPSSNILTVFNAGNGFEIGEMNWGIIPPWAKEGQFKRPLINARGETVWEKPSFKKIAKSNRCIILANGFYEWNRSESPKQPYRVTIKDCQDMAMAGIYQVSKDGEMQCCIITTQANKDMGKIHHRMPVLIDIDNLKRWIDSDDQEEADSIMSSCSDVELELKKITSYVNSTKNQGRKCIETLDSNKNSIRN